MLKTEVRITVNRLPEIAAKLPAAVRAINAKTANDIKAGAMGRTTRVDTGAMLNGYVVEEMGDGWYIIYNTQFYHLFHELGTVYIGALPMLIPSAEEARGPFIAAYQQLESYL
jgi:hypothetical protein